MQVNYLLAGLYGEEAGRHIFETMCGLLILNKEKNLNLSLISNDKINDKQFSNITSVEKFENSSLELGGTVYHMQTRKGDGGLDILVEDGESWSVYQCKFFVEGKVTTAKAKAKAKEDESKYKKSDRVTQIENSFNSALKTANEKGKTMDKWVLCIPKDLDDLEKQWFEDFKENNKSKCSNINFIGNLNLSDWLIQNENIYTYFFYRLVKEDNDIEISVYEKINEYRQQLDRSLGESSYQVLHDVKSNLSDYKELQLLIDHIKEFREEFKKILTDFKKIDNISNYNREEHKKYEQNKLFMSEAARMNFADGINKTAKFISNLTKESKIVDFKNYLQKVVENFNYYFSRSKL